MSTKKTTEPVLAKAIDIETAKEKTVKEKAITSTVNKQPVVFTIQDEHNVSQSFDIYSWIWDPSAHKWVQYDIGILSVSPYSGSINQASNGLFTVSADLKAVKHSGSSNKSGYPGNLNFTFVDRATKNIGSIFFKPGNSQWHNAGTNQSKIDIDWDWNDGSPIIELKDKD